MSRTLTANFQISVAREASLGVLPGSPSWLRLQPNTITQFGAETSDVSRQPISDDRQEYKGEVVDLESRVEVELDLTMDVVMEFLEAFMMADFVGPQSWIGSRAPVAVTTDGYTVDAGGALAAGRLVIARGFQAVGNANNGLKIVTSGSTATSVHVAGAVAELIPLSDGQNQALEECGVQFASGDVEINASGNLESTVFDFTTLPIRDGQLVKIGGSTLATQYNTVNNNTYARVAKDGISTNEIVLDWHFLTPAADPGTGKTIQLLYGPFIRVVPTSHADALIDRSHTFEGRYTDLAAVGTPAYEYPEGNMANTIAFVMPLTQKATTRLAFVGTDTPEPTTVRATNAATARMPRRTAAFNTVTKYTRLSINELDESGLNTDIKDYTITINNNVSGERVQDTLGAKYINYGLFQVDIDATMLFTDPDIVGAIRNKRTVAFKMGAANVDGGFFLDIPACTLMTGRRQFPTNESIQIQAPIKPHVGDEFPYVMSWSIFPYLPVA